MKTIVSSGTLGDRMAAMILLIQDDAVHTLQFVEPLVIVLEMQPLHLSCKEKHTKPWGSRNVPDAFLETCRGTLGQLISFPQTSVCLTDSCGPLDTFSVSLQGHS